MEFKGPTAIKPISCVVGCSAKVCISPKIIKSKISTPIAKSNYKCAYYKCAYYECAYYERAQYSFENIYLVFQFQNKHEIWPEEEKIKLFQYYIFLI